MNLRYHSAVIFTTDINKSADFYSNILGQKIIDDFGNCKVLECGISLWQIADNHIIKANHTFPSEKQIQKVEFCFETEDFSTMATELERHMIEYLHKEQTEAWGQKTIRFYDPDGNLIEAGESIPAFIKRMRNEGLNAEEIATQTAVPIETVRTILA